MSEEIKKAAKAVFTTIFTFLATLCAPMVGDIGFSELTDGQWMFAVVAGLAAGGGVYGIRNKKE